MSQANLKTSFFIRLLPKRMDHFQMRICFINVYHTLSYLFAIVMKIVSSFIPLLFVKNCSLTFISFNPALSSMVQVADRPVTRQGLAGIKTQSQGMLVPFNCFR